MRRILITGLLLFACGALALPAVCRAATPTGAPAAATASPSFPGTAATPAADTAVDQDQQEAGAILQKGIDLYHAGKTGEALTLLRGFVVRFYDSPQLPQAYFYLSRIFLDQGSYDTALLYINQIPEAQKTPEAKLVEGAALVGNGSLQQGMTELRALAKDSLDPADQPLYYATLADGTARQGKYLESLVFLHQELPLVPDADRAAVLAKAHDILTNRISDANLADAVFMLRGTPIGQDAVLQQAQRDFARGDTAGAEQLVKGIIESPLAFPYRGDAALLLDRLTGKPWLQRAVGVVLPLSGRYGTFGQLVKRGMELAVQLHNEADGKNPVRFIYRDTAADPDASAEAVSTLANEDRVMAEVGPLTGMAAQAAAYRAQQQQVPLLTLSQRDGLPQIGDEIFRDSLTSRLQVETLVKYAMDEKGLTTFGILAPRNALGKEMTDLFTQAVEARGGQVVDAETYAEDATDFRRQIRLLQGLNPDIPEPSDQSASANGDKDLEDLFVPDPTPPFQALFIPDYAERIGLIAPQLAFYGLENVQLLGINGWDSPDLLRTAGPYVEGAVFVDGFFRYSPYPFVKEFVNLYYKKYGEDPTILEAQGFDAAGILLSVLDQPDVKSRDDVRRALAEVQNYPGVTGATSFGGDGDAQKVLYLLQVKNGDIVQIDNGS
jgi:ABC-type branched-subunit amino acid transport system substrate-binding protein